MLLQWIYFSLGNNANNIYGWFNVQNLTILCRIPRATSIDQCQGCIISRCIIIIRFEFINVEAQKTVERGLIKLEKLIFLNTKKGVRTINGQFGCKNVKAK